MRVDDQDAKVLELSVPRLGQFQTICDAGTCFVRASENVEPQCEVSRAPCHRSGDGKIALTREGLSTRRALAAKGHETKRRLVGANSAIVRWDAQRASDIR